MPYEIRVRLLAGPDDDLIAWLAALESAPYGTRSQTIREALRRGLRGSLPSVKGDIRPELLERLAELPTAGQLRAIVEAALAEHTVSASNTSLQADVEDAFGAGLDALFSLEEDE